MPVVCMGDVFYRQAYDRLSETDRNHPCVFKKVYEELDRMFPLWILNGRGGMTILRGYETDPNDGGMLPPRLGQVHEMQR